MFERYTEKARRIIFFARYEASQFGAEAIEPEHILLGIMREDKQLIRIIFPDPHSWESIRNEIEVRTTLRDKISASVDLPLSPSGKRVLSYAADESDKLRHNNIIPAHLLLGILREKKSTAAEILYERGLHLDAIRALAKRYPNFDPTNLIDIAVEAQSTDLNLSNYGLEEVPKSIVNLKSLRKLNLSRNRLAILPDFIGQLSKLEHLDLSDNFLTALPDSLLSIRSLEILNLKGNNNLGLPEELLWTYIDNEPHPAHPASILEYYYRIRESQRSLNEAKLILVGRGAAGKTSVVNRLVFGLFNQGEEVTEGIQITKWNIRLEKGELIRLNIWDFGGQEILHATHQFFLTHRSVYVLVLSGREGSQDADAEYWLKIIDSFGEFSPVIVVLNKSKAYPFDVNRRALQQKYPHIRDFINTDCADGTGIEQLRKAIETETDRLEYLRTPFPENWFTIKEKLAVMKTNYLSYDEYREQCARLGEKDPLAQEALSSYLHHLGIALNYKDDPRLQDTYVLNPHWVTNGIYTILSSEKLKKSGGEIELKDLSVILDGKNYPKKLHRFILDLMKKFELCFSFPDDDCHYLIPELLDNQEPLEATSFSANECLNFQYHYPVLPEGLLPRFIVRTHVLSEGVMRWRSGVILKFESNRALVKADIQDRKVFIYVSGPLSGRRRLLAIIRSDFEHIHRTIRNLQPREMVPLPEYPDVVVPYDKLLAMEREGIEEFPEFTGDSIVKIKVNDLVNGIDLEGDRLREILVNEPIATIRLFYSYSHKDESLRDELNTHLKLMQRQGLIKSWYDRNIDAGDDWKRRIDENLEQAHIILLLVSANFIASDYCYEKELKRALERHTCGEAEVIPVIVRDVDLNSAPFAGLQYLPTDAKAVTLWENRDSAWRSVAEGIRKVAESIRQRRSFK